MTVHDSNHLQTVPNFDDRYAKLHDANYNKPRSNSQDGHVTVGDSIHTQPVPTSQDGYVTLKDPHYVKAVSNLKDGHATVDENEHKQPAPISYEDIYEPMNRVNKMSAINPLYHMKENLQEIDKDKSDEYASPRAIGQYKTANDNANAKYRSLISNKKLLNGRGTYMDNPEYMSKIDAQLF
ncbi:uncharacterized protein LOC124445289 [Xenia sp. Carnegie-2017]|uniref:uncharacterized protein LOC124445289 n=1 Tax=Xenia sp. Carnegie-2017 TaxID=2897299 RepID=UPI001F0346C1|nr:uncharacterized protein LOC124445289 [Xenia sp. Carnegie-2017]